LSGVGVLEAANPLPMAGCITNNGNHHAHAHGDGQQRRWLWSRQGLHQHQQPGEGNTWRSG
jgi:hypothetical protein